MKRKLSKDRNFRLHGGENCRGEGEDYYVEFLITAVELKNLHSAHFTLFTSPRYSYLFVHCFRESPISYRRPNSNASLNSPPSSSPLFSSHFVAFLSPSFCLSALFSPLRTRLILVFIGGHDYTRTIDATLTTRSNGPVSQILSLCQLFFHAPASFRLPSENSAPRAQL